VEWATTQHGLTGVDQASLWGPLGSDWSDPPPLTELEPLFDGKDPALGKHAHTIAFSVNHHGDFGHYSMKVHEWTAVPRTEDEFPKNRESAIDVVRGFEKSLTKRQHEALIAYAKTLIEWASRTGDYDAIKPARERVVNTVRGERRRVLTSRIAPLMSELTSRTDDIRAPEFSKSALQRFVLDWVAKSGWTSDRFGEFDSRVRGHGREEHKAERIGKKYQWIAYHEGLARISDNFRIQSGQSYREWSLDLRDIDPGLLLSAMPTDDGERPSFTWWNPHPGIDLAPNETITTWIASTTNLPDPRRVIGRATGTR
jgi:hypothetical protein